MNTDPRVILGGQGIFTLVYWDCWVYNTRYMSIGYGKGNELCGWSKNMEELEVSRLLVEPKEAYL